MMCDVHKLKKGYKHCTSQQKYIGMMWGKRRKQKIWLCRKCWDKVADSDLEW